MSGMLGATATASVKASRQAEGGGGAGGGCSAFFSSVPAAGRALAAGASAGRGLGKGVLAMAKALPAAICVWPKQAKTSAAAVTMAAARALPHQEAHLRHPLSALDFAPIRTQEPRKATAHSGGTLVCLV